MCYLPSLYFSQVYISHTFQVYISPKSSYFIINFDHGVVNDVVNCFSLISSLHLISVSWGDGKHDRFFFVISVEVMAEETPPPPCLAAPTLPIFDIDSEYEIYPTVQTVNRCREPRTMNLTQHQTALSSVRQQTAPSSAGDRTSIGVQSGLDDKDDATLDAIIFKKQNSSILKKEFKAYALNPLNLVSSRSLNGVNSYYRWSLQASLLYVENRFSDKWLAADKKEVPKSVLKVCKFGDFFFFFF